MVSLISHKLPPVSGQHLQVLPYQQPLYSAQTSSHSITYHLSLNKQTCMTPYPYTTVTSSYFFALLSLLPSRYSSKTYANAKPLQQGFLVELLANKVCPSNKTFIIQKTQGALSAFLYLSSMQSFCLLLLQEQHSVKQILLSTL